jgi:hypothetical protein
MAQLLGGPCCPGSMKRTGESVHSTSTRTRGIRKDAPRIAQVYGEGWCPPCRTTSCDGLDASVAAVGDDHDNGDGAGNR